MIEQGKTIPEGTIRLKDASGIKEISTQDYFKDKRVVMFGLPGAFTGTCSQKHLPSFIEHSDAILAKGYTIACIAVNDPHVMKAWGDTSNVDGKIDMLSDSDCSLTAAMGLDKQFGAVLGHRSKRYAMIIDNGVITKLFVDESGFNLSSAENVFENL